MTMARLAAGLYKNSFQLEICIKKVFHGLKERIKRTLIMDIL